MSFDPQVSAVAAALIAGYMMTASGVHKRMLEWRRPPRRCPSCRRLQRDCTCRESERRHDRHRWLLR